MPAHGRSAAGDPKNNAWQWYERIARTGFVAKGVVHVLVGMLAAGAAMGDGRAEGSQGALRSIDTGLAGAALLALVAAGLVCYAIWRLVSAIANPEGDHAGKRTVHFLSGFIYTSLAVEAGRLALSGARGSSGNNAPHWTAEVMSRPFGGWAVAIAGAGLVLFGLYQLYRGFTAHVTKHLDLARATSRKVDWIERSGRAGIAARGVVFGLMGVFLIQAALHRDPSEARDLGGALRALEQQTYGSWLLAVVAAGLVAYGLFQFVHARHRRLATS